MKRIALALVAASLVSAEKVPDATWDTFMAQIREGQALDSLGDLKIRNGEALTREGNIQKIQGEAIGKAALRQMYRALGLGPGDSIREDRTVIRAKAK